MNSNQKMWAWVGGVVAVIVIGTIGYVAYKSHETSANTGASSVSVTQPASTASSTVAQILDIKHQYVNGTHTYAGSMNVPNPCTTLALQAVQDPENANDYTLVFTTSESAADVSDCAQVETSRPFKVSFAAPQSAIVNATLNGAPLTLNVFEVPAGEDLDTYSINLKG